MEAAEAPHESAPRGSKRSGRHSGRLLLRMPEALHAELARASERAGVSLNAFINDALAQTLGRRGNATPAAPPRTQARQGRRLLERLLVVNVVVLAAVGVLAILLLVQALR